MVYFYANKACFAADPNLKKYPALVERKSYIKKVYFFKKKLDVTKLRQKLIFMDATTNSVNMTFYKYKMNIFANICLIHFYFYVIFDKCLFPKASINVIRRTFHFSTQFYKNVEILAFSYS